MDGKNIRLLSRNYIPDKLNLSIESKTINHDFALHWHEFFEIEIILQGKGTAIFNGRQYEIKRGSIYLLNPTDFHEIKVESEITLINIMFSESLLTEPILYELLSQKQDTIKDLNTDEFERINTLMQLMLNEYLENKDYKKEYLINLMECLIILILRHFNVTMDNKTPRENTPINKAIYYIITHFRENPSLAETAQKVNYNPNYFSEIFHKTTGKSYIAYLNDIKLNYAKLLLLSSNLSISEISSVSGFNSVSNFARAFNQAEKVSPSGYREINKR